MSVWDWIPGIGTRRLHARLQASQKKVDLLRKRSQTLSDQLGVRKQRSNAERQTVKQAFRLKTGRNTPEPDQEIELATLGAVPFKAIAISIDGMKLYVPERASREAHDKLFDRTVHYRAWPVDAIHALLPFAHGNLMLDVGANIGTTSLPRAIFGVFQKIHAFEPEPKNFSCLVQAIEANGLSERITAWPYAVGAESGEAKLYLSRGIGRHFISAEGGISVPVVTMDGWLSQHNVDREAVDFVKVDTQGYEPFVLEGARRLIEGRKATWQLELAPTLMRKVGSDVDRLTTLLKAYFSHFLDLRQPERGLQPIASVDETIASLSPGHTDIIALP